MKDVYFGPIVLIVSLVVIGYAFVVFSNVNISTALFRGGFLGRTSEVDEKVACRPARFDGDVLRRGGEICLKSTLLLLITTERLEDMGAQIRRHIEVVAPLFKWVHVVVVAPFGRGFTCDLENVTLSIKFTGKDFETNSGKDFHANSGEEFRVYRYQWEEHYGILNESGADYRMNLDVDYPGRIFRRGIKESICYLDRNPGISGVGFRTIAPRGRMYPRRGGTGSWKKILPEGVPYGAGMVDSPEWDMGLYRIPPSRDTSGRRVMNTNMVYLINDL